MVSYLCFFFFQAEDGIRDLVRSRGLGDVYKRQAVKRRCDPIGLETMRSVRRWTMVGSPVSGTLPRLCLLYTSDAADDLLCVDLGGRRIIKKKKYD